MPFQWIGKSEDGKTVTLKHLDTLSFPVAEYATENWLIQNQDLVRQGAVVDCETSGLNHADEEIIEIGVQTFLFNKETGEILKLLKSYSQFQEPLKPIRPEITLITGITNEMLAHHKINWQEVDELLKDSHIVLAHNAKFDRPFVDKKSKESPNKIWGCSIKQIDWLQRGYTSSKLELLCVYHGFFMNAHRAIHDAKALLYILASKDSIAPQKTYLADILDKAKRPTTQVIALASPFETKDILKHRGYSWDVQNRYWAKIVDKEEAKTEVQWLEENVYLGAFRGIARDIPLVDNFKAN